MRKAAFLCALFCSAVLCARLKPKQNIGVERNHTDLSTKRQGEELFDYILTMVVKTAMERQQSKPLVPGLPDLQLKWADRAHMLAVILPDLRQIQKLKSIPSCVLGKFKNAILPRLYLEIPRFKSFMGGSFSVEFSGFLEIKNDEYEMEPYVIPLGDTVELRFQVEYAESGCRDFNPCFKANVMGAMELLATGPSTRALHRLRAATGRTYSTYQHQIIRREQWVNWLIESAFEIAIPMMMYAEFPVNGGAWKTIEHAIRDENMRSQTFVWILLTVLEDLRKNALCDELCRTLGKVTASKAACSAEAAAIAEWYLRSNPRPASMPDQLRELCMDPEEPGELDAAYLRWGWNLREPKLRLTNLKWTSSTPSNVALRGLVGNIPDFELSIDSLPIPVLGEESALSLQPSGGALTLNFVHKTDHAKVYPVPSIPYIQVKPYTRDCIPYCSPKEGCDEHNLTRPLRAGQRLPWCQHPLLITTILPRLESARPFETMTPDLLDGVMERFRRPPSEQPKTIATRTVTRTFTDFQKTFFGTVDFVQADMGIVVNFPKGSSLAFTNKVINAFLESNFGTWLFKGMNNFGGSPHWLNRHHSLRKQGVFINGHQNFMCTKEIVQFMFENAERLEPGDGLINYATACCTHRIMAAKPEIREICCRSEHVAKLPEMNGQCCLPALLDGQEFPGAFWYPEKGRPQVVHKISAGGAREVAELYARGCCSFPDSWAEMRQDLYLDMCCKPPLKDHASQTVRQMCDAAVQRKNSTGLKVLRAMGLSDCVENW